MDKLTFDIPKETARELERNLLELANAKKRICALVELYHDEPDFLNNPVFVRELSRYYDAYMTCGVIVGILKNTLIPDMPEMLMYGFTWEVNSEYGTFAIHKR